MYIELYDLESDPYELESIHEGADPALVEDLKANLKASRPAPRKGAGRPRTLRSTLFSSP